MRVRLALAVGLLCAGNLGPARGHLPTLKKVHADRKQALDPEDAKRNMAT